MQMPPPFRKAVQSRMMQSRAPRKMMPQVPNNVRESTIPLLSHPRTAIPSSTTRTGFSNSSPGRPITGTL